MQKVDRLMRLQKAGVVAVVRGDSPEVAEKTADAVIAGGVTAIELTFTVPHADQVIANLTKKYADDKSVVIGAGTVLDPATARVAMIAGAEFVVSPSFNPETAKMCNLYATPYTPGCMSPTEMQQALESGVDLVKLFPGAVMKPAMVKAVLAPFPYLSIMPTGGVNVDNMAEWFAAGVALVGAGSNLTAGAKTGDYAAVTAQAKKYQAKLAEIRG
ncbi:bifunctional 2-keto-4-hydroxyglutarate aldolase/2-keto-3-deoxy-6-phosphogluconate aldolase [Schleiferilactobacillus shenzhenensis]|uniref:2-dehydro-3-deoxyphosphogluconate aldolase / 4-hydroxy-2-oxoglutarate aldolase n=1 Tax=Schleiferilactobacillus shenzhenensis LY-73 TaxID=1231336 RepID=U4TJN6_9LACO|nr:bifunctional 2-keto-4-hydroxyglutarate aldolase/2-keto-3-deoxy-6-phosphogluconate aldolase [Schleiferilactobacillus shenzhenensis]ERL65046.1 2-dehydro-3-deoxyphosphogluconate aldolase / 4-hydroxy-2-oxoglutarate aldolase [Schleiferilactobacillus shenzhenensis LY-73]